MSRLITQFAWVLITPMPFDKQVSFFDFPLWSFDIIGSLMTICKKKQKLASNVIFAMFT